MMRTPEPTSPIPDIDKYWLDIYKAQRAVWVEQLLPLIDEGHTQALIFLDAATVEFNEKETVAAKDALDQYNQLVPAVSNYGETNEDEAFAEAFRHYCLGLGMTRDQLESFRSVLVKGASLVRRVVARFLANSA